LRLEPSWLLQLQLNSMCSKNQKQAAVVAGRCLLAGRLGIAQAQQQASPCLSAVYEAHNLLSCAMHPCLQVLDVLQRMITAKGWSCLRLDGSCSIKQRQGLVDTFNDPAHPSFVFLVSSKAGGVGLNIIGGNRLVL
jgi:hypothetical protein